MVWLVQCTNVHHQEHNITSSVKPIWVLHFYLTFEYTRGGNGNDYGDNCVDDIDNDVDDDNDDNGLLSVLTLRQRLTHSVHTACYRSSL